MNKYRADAAESVPCSRGTTCVGTVCSMANNRWAVLWGRAAAAATELSQPVGAATQNRGESGSPGLTLNRIRPPRLNYSIESIMRRHLRADVSGSASKSQYLFACWNMLSLFYLVAAGTGGRKFMHDKHPRVPAYPAKDLGPTGRHWCIQHLALVRMTEFQDGRCLTEYDYPTAPITISLCVVVGGGGRSTARGGNTRDDEQQIRRSAGNYTGSCMRREPGRSWRRGRPRRTQQQLVGAD